MSSSSHTGVTPLTPARLMEIADGFRMSKVLSVALEMELFTKLSGSAGTTPAEFAASEGIAERPARMLLIACASLGLLEKRGDRYHNSAESEEFLVAGKRYFFGDLVRFVDRREYAGWGKLEEAIRRNRPTTWDPDAAETVFFEGDDQMLELFWSALYSGATFTARALGLSVDFRPFRRLLDVGAGSGSFCLELCRMYPELHATVYDQPFVCEMADKNIADANLGGRVDSHAGDFWAEDLPPGYDVMLLSNILHDWNPQQNKTLLGKCHAALPAGGAVVITESFVDDDGAGPVAGAVASINMLIETTEGVNYSRAEYEELLRAVGFSRIDRIGFIVDAAGANGALVAYKS
nr:o-methyltransferase [Amycolatopsis sp.]